MSAKRTYVVGKPAQGYLWAGQDVGPLCPLHKGCASGNLYGRALGKHLAVGALVVLKARGAASRSGASRCSRSMTCLIPNLFDPGLTVIDQHVDIEVMGTSGRGKASWRPSAGSVPRGSSCRPGLSCAALAEHRRPPVSCFPSHRTVPRAHQHLTPEGRTSDE